MARVCISRFLFLFSLYTAAGTVAAADEAIVNPGKSNTEPARATGGPLPTSAGPAPGIPSSASKDGSNSPPAPLPSDATVIVATIDYKTVTETFVPSTISSYSTLAKETTITSTNSFDDPVTFVVGSGGVAWLPFGLHNDAPQVPYPSDPPQAEGQPGNGSPGQGPAPTNSGHGVPTPSSAQHSDPQGTDPSSSNGDGPANTFSGNPSEPSSPSNKPDNGDPNNTSSNEPLASKPSGAEPLATGNPSNAPLNTPGFPIGVPSPSHAITSGSGGTGGISGGEPSPTQHSGNKPSGTGNPTGQPLEPTGVPTDQPSPSGGVNNGPVGTGGIAGSGPTPTQRSGDQPHTTGDSTGGPSEPSGFSDGQPLASGNPTGSPNRNATGMPSATEPSASKSLAGDPQTTGSSGSDDNGESTPSKGFGAQPTDDQLPAQTGDDPLPSGQQTGGMKPSSVPDNEPSSSDALSSGQQTGGTKPSSAPNDAPSPTNRPPEPNTGESNPTQPPNTSASPDITQGPGGTQGAPKPTQAPDIFSASAPNTVITQNGTEATFSKQTYSEYADLSSTTTITTSATVTDDDGSTHETSFPVI
ncbi:MAG: hypothetical protein Q9168_007120, partial [Polycauliona sp. 1 TL-2023]